MAKKKEEFVKVQFHDPAVGYENLWATDMMGNHYRIESIPFFIYGISLGDVVAVSPDNEGRLQFSKLVESSGNRTLRARSDDFIKNAARRKKVTAGLKKLGAGVEELRSRLLAINVPLNIDLKAVTDYLTDDAKVSWEYANPAK
jgi:hypothetical protein